MQWNYFCCCCFTRYVELLQQVCHWPFLLCTSSAKTLAENDFDCELLLDILRCHRSRGVMDLCAESLA